MKVNGILNGLRFLVIPELSLALTPCHTIFYLDYVISEAFQWDYWDQWQKPHINGIQLTARDRFLARGEAGWLLLITIRESKITVLVISQLLICHSIPEITHLTHMVPFQEMTSKPCRSSYIIRMFLVECSICPSNNYLCVLYS